MFTRSWVRCIQSINLHSISLRFILPISFPLPLCLPTNTSLQPFPTKPYSLPLVCFPPHLSLAPAPAPAPAHPILLDFITQILFAQDYNHRSLQYEVLPTSCCFLQLMVTLFLQQPVPEHHEPVFAPWWRSQHFNPYRTPGKIKVQLLLILVF